MGLHLNCSLSIVVFLNVYIVCITSWLTSCALFSSSRSLSLSEFESECGKGWYLDRPRDLRAEREYFPSSACLESKWLILDHAVIVSVIFVDLCLCLCIKPVDFESI